MDMSLGEMKELYIEVLMDTLLKSSLGETYDEDRTSEAADGLYAIEMYEAGFSVETILETFDREYETKIKWDKATEELSVELIFLDGDENAAG